MSDRLISADKAREVLKHLLYETAMDNDIDIAEIYEDIAERRLDTWIELIPTVDAERHGRWEYVGGNLYRCSVCHKGLADDDNILTGQENYCGVCGAKMDERKNGQ